MTTTPPDIDRILRETFVARAEYHQVLGSTNDRAIRCAADGSNQLPLLVVAERQTAGRGRGGNRWWTGEGGLAMSLLLGRDVSNPPGAPAPLVSLAAALAVVETVAPLLQPSTVGICWPNDVVITERKLGGILVEVLPDRRQVIGIGLNTNSSLADAPPELQRTATTLRDLTSATHDQTAILVTLLRHLESALTELASAPQRLAARADALCLQRGKTLTLQVGNRSASGRCAGIAPDGALLLESSEGRQAFYSGVVLKPQEPAEG